MPKPMPGPQPFLPHACASVLEVASAPTVMVRAASVPAAILVNLVIGYSLPELVGPLGPFMPSSRAPSGLGSPAGHREIFRTNMNRIAAAGVATIVQGRALRGPVRSAGMMRREQKL